MAKNALAELLEELSCHNQNLGSISEYHILFSPREKGFTDYRHNEIKGVNVKNLENFLDMEYETDINFQKLHGWISFKDGSWLERFFDFNMEHWVYARRPTIENDREYLKDF